MEVDSADGAHRRAADPRTLSGDRPADPAPPAAILTFNPRPAYSKRDGRWQIRTSADDHGRDGDEHRKAVEA